MHPSSLSSHQSALPSRRRGDSSPFMIRFSSCLLFLAFLFASVFSFAGEKRIGLKACGKRQEKSVRLNAR
jgi:hypothetical protein